MKKAVLPVQLSTLPFCTSSGQTVAFVQHHILSTEMDYSSLRRQLALSQGCTVIVFHAFQYRQEAQLMVTTTDADKPVRRD